MKETHTEEPFYLKLHRHEVPTRREFHDHFGGIIYGYDFDVRYKHNASVKEESEIAARIARDYAMEKQILKTKNLDRRYKQNEKRGRIF